MKKCSVGIKPTGSHVYFMPAFTFSVEEQWELQKNYIIPQIDVFMIYSTLPLYSVPYNAAEAKQACP